MKRNTNPLMRLYVTLWERIAYYHARPLFTFTLWLYFDKGLPIEANPLGWEIVAWYWGIADRLIPGKQDRTWRRQHCMEAV